METVVVWFSRASSELQPTSPNDILMTICVFVSLRKCREQHIASRVTPLRSTMLNLYVNCATHSVLLNNTYISCLAVFLWKMSAENKCSSIPGSYKKCEKLKVKSTREAICGGLCRGIFQCQRSRHLWSMLSQSPFGSVAWGTLTRTETLWESSLIFRWCFRTLIQAEWAAFCVPADCEEGEDKRTSCWSF